MHHQVASGKVYFVGAGPGAPDLITVRGRSMIEQADLVLYADSLVQASVAGLARKPNVRIVGSSELHLEQLIDLMSETAQAGGVVARVHTGDPALFGAIHEQMRLLAARGIAYEIVPGVTAAFAAAARLGVELTVPGLTQTVILGRIAGRTAVPAPEALPALASHGASLALYLSIDQIEQVVSELLAGGVYTKETPVAVVYRATWPDEQVIRGTLGDIAAAVRAAGYSRHALILVGQALSPGTQALPSRLYAANFAHGYRSAEIDPPTTQPINHDSRPISVVAVTRQGSVLAERLARELGGTALLPARFASEMPQAQPYDGPVAEVIRQCWAEQTQLVLVMATGIAVRSIAPLLSAKKHDPAVVCLDEAGRSVIPLLGGHRAGANALARRLAALTGGHAAITTASDTQSLPALDLLGQAEGWQIAEDAALTHAMGCLVNGEPLACYVDPLLPTQRRQLELWLAGCPDLTFVEQPEDLLETRYHAALLISHRELAELWPALQAKTVRYSLPLLVIGIGCRRGVPAEELYAALDLTLDEAGLDGTCIAALASIELKASEPGLIALAEVLGVPLEVVSASQLSALDPAAFSPSAASARLDLPGVAEPCAVLAAGGPLLVSKRAFARCTVAVALRGADETVTRRPDDAMTRRPDDAMTRRPDDAMARRPDDAMTRRPDDAMARRPDEAILPRDTSSPPRVTASSPLSSSPPRITASSPLSSSPLNSSPPRVTASSPLSSSPLSSSPPRVTASSPLSSSPPRITASSPLSSSPLSSSPPAGQLSLVSLGPGDPQQMTLAAHAALREAEVVIGYQGYIDALADLLTPTQQVLASGMKTETERAVTAIELATAGQRVALVSSGDIGIYAMAGPVFELLHARAWTGDQPRLTVLPGISAFQAAAATLGAAISHDFSVISLSDLLTPWALIERRLRAAAAGDFVVALYNPRSKERHWQLGAALDLLRAHRPANTPVAFATNITRPDERLHLTTLAAADPTEAAMFTVVLVGNSRSYQSGAHMVTPRGYAETKWRGNTPDQPPEPAAPQSSPYPDYPLVLTKLGAAPVVVVGGGAVAERKVTGLLAVGAAVRLISPQASPQLAAWTAAGRISWEQRPYAAGNLDDARLVFAATDQREVNAQVAREAAALGLLCNVADSPDEGSFHVPALYRGAELTIAVSTGGVAPARAAALRDNIAQWLQTSATEHSHER